MGRNFGGEPTIFAPEAGKVGSGAQANIAEGPRRRMDFPGSPGNEEAASAVFPPHG
jgi:hypothetical protein